MASGHHPNSALVSTPERIAALTELWELLLQAMLKIMRAAVETGTMPRASTLGVVRAFLVDNGVCGDGLSASRHAEALEKLAADFGPIDIDEDGTVVRLHPEAPEISGSDDS